MTKKQCPLGENCDLTTAWMAGAAKAQDQIKAQAAEIERLEKACSEWAEVSQSNYHRAKAAEAKLAKAVEALEGESHE